MGAGESGRGKEKGQAMTLAQQTAAFLGMDPSPQQLGFLLSVLAAFIAGWAAKAARDKVRTARWKRALWRGERMGVRR